MCVHVCTYTYVQIYIHRENEGKNAEKSSAVGDVNMKHVQAFGVICCELCNSSKGGAQEQVGGDRICAHRVKPMVGNLLVVMYGFIALGECRGSIPSGFFHSLCRKSPVVRGRRWWGMAGSLCGSFVSCVRCWMPAQGHSLGRSLPGASISNFEAHVALGFLGKCFILASSLGWGAMWPSVCRGRNGQRVKAPRNHTATQGL